MVRAAGAGPGRAWPGLVWSAGLRGPGGPAAPSVVCVCAVPLFQRRSLAPSQLAKRKAGDDEEEEEEDRHPATVSEVPLECGGLRGAGLAAAGLGRARLHAVAGAGDSRGRRGGGGLSPACQVVIAPVF